MIYEEFKNKYIGRGIDFDGYYGYQCADLSEQYNKEVVGAARIGGNAKDAVNNYDKTKYNYIANTPTGVPLKGDIVVWEAMPYNPYGHIAIFDNGNVDSFISLDQNWPVGSLVHLQPHNYNYVLGWLHPKAPVALTDAEWVSKAREIMASGITDTQRRQQILALK